MAVVQSLAGLVDTASQTAAANSYGSLRLYDRYYYDYATLYRVQPNVRTCVDFLARNIGQLGLHVFQRVSETDRKRLRDHPLAQLIEKPLPAEFKVTRFRLIESLLGDLGVYFNAFWLKLKVSDGPMGLLRVPPQYVETFGDLVPRYYELHLGGQAIRIPLDQMVHFRGYNAVDPLVGLSPLETLRRVLAEEAAMGDYREYFWANSARMGGVLERPAEAPLWSETARERFKAEFEALYAGGANSGRTAILEEGMSWKQTTFNAQESEYLAGRRLTREECARAYHIPLPMVGILDHATFSNIREQHKNLYQDCLGPWLAMIEQEIMLQLLPEFTSDGVYVEFNIQEKLQGDFDEQTKSLQSAVGRPWMTADEARARMNLPSMGGEAGRLVTPLNVISGGQASPRDSAPGKAGLRPAATKAAKEGTVDPTLPELRERHQEKWAEVMARHFRRQMDAIVPKVPGKATTNTLALAERGTFGAQKRKVEDLYDAERWNRELRDDFYRMNVATATVWARYVAEQMSFEELDEDRMLPWLEENARVASENINGTTLEELRAALEGLEDDEDPKEAARHVFDVAITWRAVLIAIGAVTRGANFGSQEGAKQSGLKNKTWNVNSANPRDDHAAMNGETVGIDELFSNGLLWPGDPSGSAEDNAHCQCSVTFGR